MKAKAECMCVCVIVQSSQSWCSLELSKISIPFPGACVPFTRKTISVSEKTYNVVPTFTTTEGSFPIYSTISYTPPPIHRWLQRKKKKRLKIKQKCVLSMNLRYLYGIEWNLGNKVVKTNPFLYTTHEEEIFTTTLNVFSTLLNFPYFYRMLLFPSPNDIESNSKRSVSTYLLLSMIFHYIDEMHELSSVNTSNELMSTTYMILLYNECSVSADNYTYAELRCSIF